MASLVHKKKIGFLGGGQLAKMLVESSFSLSLHQNLYFLDPNGSNSSAASVLANGQIVHGSFKDYLTVVNFVNKNGIEVLSIEIEDVNIEALEEVEKIGVKVYPSAKTLNFIKDKYAQKIQLKKSGVNVGKFYDLQKLGESFPIMVKSRGGGYDGRGNFIVKNLEDFEQWKVGRDLDGYYAEGWVDYKYELSVCVLVRGKEVVIYEPVVTFQEESVCALVLAYSAEIDQDVLTVAVREKAKRVSLKAVQALNGEGIFSVELFVSRDGEVLVNEIAPRPHNSYHVSQNAHVTSQFENHLRLLSALELGCTDLRTPVAAMVNILGLETEQETLELISSSLELPEVKLHWYNKTPLSTGRKLGHMNILADSVQALNLTLKKINPKLVCLIENYFGYSTARDADVMVIMGSDSDLPVMQAACNTLASFNVPYKTSFISAHRTPEYMNEFATSASSKGVKVIIAGAGGAAHLPGMVAAMTSLPVIGVPIKTKNNTVGGVDALYSIVQMPRGVPVATVAINNAMNAGLLAVKILGVSDLAVRKRLEWFAEEQSMKVVAKREYLDYLDGDGTEYLGQGGVDNVSPYILYKLRHFEEDPVLSLPGYQYYKGKVRDCYFGEKQAIIFASDRMSAFDRSLGYVPFKGDVLNQISLYWFKEVEDIIGNHLLSFGVEKELRNVSVVEKCNMFPIEFVVRAYLTGSTSTSIWMNYSKNDCKELSYCGHAIPAGLKKNQVLPKVICTPTTKSDVHDELISGEEIVRRELMTEADFKFCEEKAIEIFMRGQEVARKKGLILVDTKYELGRNSKGEIVLCDEVHTPDCSRYWLAASYEERMLEGKEPESFDKEFLRLWFKENCDPYSDAELPVAPEKLMIKMSKKYLEMYNMITGNKLQPRLMPRSAVSEAITQLLKNC
eukprot:snap_masked-scaffold_9-processed-gene-13.68-mRNA-1 protein AED:0.00 eAED:0.00 QI:0/-1/0/1/-1/1/1/0/902